MSRFLRNVAAGLVAVSMAGGATGARAETLTDALISAYKNSDLLEQNRALLRAADEDVAQAVAALRPILSFVASADYNDNIQGSSTSGSLALSGTMTLYDGGSNKLATDATKETVLATRADLMNVEQSVLSDAVQAYMDVRSATQNVALGENNVRLITQQLRAARDRFEVGEVTRTDVALAESRLAASRSSLVAAQGALAAARESYKLAIGHYPTTLTGVPSLPKLPATLDAARAIAVRSHPSIQSAQHNVAVADLNIARARTGLGPKLTGDVGFGVDDNGDDASSIGLTLAQPIYRGGQLKSVLRQARAVKDAASAGLLQVVRQIELQVGTAFANVAVSRAQLLATDQQIQAAQLAFEGTQEEARLGSRTTLDVLDAEQELLDARAARVQAEADQYVAAYTVLASMGLLTVDYLQLGIPTYDPAAYYNAVRNAPVRSTQGNQLDKVLKSLGKQ